MDEMNRINSSLCVGLLAHVDAGKTTLSEAILYINGNLRKLGRVDNKDAFLDTYDQERERGITIFSKQAILSMENKRITLLDTPGHMDFGAEMERTLQVLDYAVLVINGADGVQGHTRTLWKLLEYYRIPVFIFVNKMDQEGTNKEDILVELGNVFSEGCIDFTETISTCFYESLAVCGEELLNEYLETTQISKESIQKGIKQRKIFPVCFGSALRLFGVKELLDVILTYGIAPKYPEKFQARVFKISRDEQGNRLTHLKITGGCLKVKEEIDEEKINQIRLYSGQKYEMVSEVKAGSICAVTGLTKTAPGSGLGNEKEFVIPLLEPVLHYGIILPAECDVAQFLPKIKQLEEEEPGLRVFYQERCKQIQIQLMGEVQIEVLKRIIFERFGVKVEFDTGQIIYKESIAKPVEGVGHFEPLRHYAEVHLLLEPLETGSGLVFDIDCSEDVLSKNWQRLILTHIKEKEHRGVLTGSAITDMKITLVAGSAHEKHTEGGDFRQAVYRAIRQGLRETDSILLEPWYSFYIEVPEKLIGRAMTDIEKRFGTFKAPEYEKEFGILQGIVPVSTMQDYRKELYSYSGGMGKLYCDIKGYFPCHNTEEVIEKIGYDVESDIENPTGSVFCAHGAGYNVPWNKVKEFMHIPAVFVTKESKEVKEEKIEKVQRKGFSVDEKRIGQEEIEEILNRTFCANKKEKVRPVKKIPQTEPVYKSFQPVKRKPKYLLVDGYNIIFAWEDLASIAGKKEEKFSSANLDAARGKLMDIMCNYQAITGYEVILVFDAYRVSGQKVEWTDYHNIHVVFTKEAETADQYIEKFAHENRKDYEITVATSDGLEQIIIRGQGCTLISARELQEEVIRSNKELMEQYL